MLIRADEELAGVPILKIREFFRRADSIWGIDFLRSELDLSQAAAEQLLQELIVLSYVKQDTNWPHGQHWAITEKASRLALASAAKPIKRLTAEKKLKEFLNRVEQLNHDERFLYQVTEVVVFGSYLTNKDRLGDVDLAIELKPRERDRKKFEALYDQKMSEAYRSGRRFRNLSEQVGWPQQEVFLFLKNHSRTISIHSLSDQVVQNTERKTLYILK